MFVGWVGELIYKEEIARKRPSHSFQLTTKDNNVKFAIVDGLVLI